MVHEVGGVSGSQPIDPAQFEKAAPAPAASASVPVDQAEISAEARLVEKLHEMDGIREERVAELRALIESGEYETEERLRAAIDRLLDEGV